MLPRSIPQGHRWFLLKVHLNAPMTSSRVAAAGRAETRPCPFCGMAGGDAWRHLTRCGVVMSVCDRLFAAGRMSAMHDAQPMLMMQHEVDGGSMAATIAVFASVWRVRVSCFALEIAPSVDALYELIIKCLDCPWLVRCAPSTDRKQRRQAYGRPCQLTVPRSTDPMAPAEARAKTAKARVAGVQRSGCQRLRAWGKDRLTERLGATSVRARQTTSLSTRGSLHACAERLACRTQRWFSRSTLYWLPGRWHATTLGRADARASCPCETDAELWATS